MSPFVAVFVITLLSSILYNKFDTNSEKKTRNNGYYTFDRSNEKSAKNEHSKYERQSSEFLDESADRNGFSLENISELDVCIFTVKWRFYQRRNFSKRNFKPVKTSSQCRRNW